MIFQFLSGHVNRRRDQGTVYFLQLAPWVTKHCKALQESDHAILIAIDLQVCDALLLTKAGVPVLVDWRRKGLEGQRF